jgi:hypothetical protein
MTMKDHLEDKFRDAVNQYELPYDPAAWNDLAGALDKRLPTNGNGYSWKWFLGGGLLIVIATTIFLFTNTSKSVSEKVSANSPNAVNETSKNSSSYTDKENTGTIKANNQERLGNESSFAEVQFDQEKTTVVTDVTEGDKRSTEVNTSEQKTLNSNPISPKKIDPETAKTILYPKLADLCLGDNVTIENSNDTDIFLSDLNKVYPIPAGKKFNFTAENPGNYYFGKSVNGKIEYSINADFKVKSSFQASIEVNGDSKYEYGVPTTELVAKANESCSFSWNIETIKGEMTGKEIKTHFYNKGRYNVVLKATPKDGGCEATVIREISIDETYNLLAVNSFWPNSSNPKNATFMPYALTERNTDFSMLIIDPTNGVTLFETSDATYGWNGTNRTTGQLVDANKAFIWIVKLKNPLPGEKSEYKGTIVRMP